MRTHTIPYTCAVCCTGNILLQNDPSRPHGFATKISDFGMCRIKDMEVVESLQGTYSHMAPEVIQHREFSEVSAQLPVLKCFLICPLT